MYQSSNLVGTLRLIDSIGLRVERPCSPCSWRIPWYFSRSLAHTHADIDPTMPNMCTGAFYVLQRLNNSCAIYAIYTVVNRVFRIFKKLFSCVFFCIFWQIVCLQFFSKVNQKIWQLKNWNYHPNPWTISLLVMRRFSNYAKNHCSFIDRKCRKLW